MNGPPSKARWVLYKARNIKNGKIYIGVSGNWPKRKATHRNDAAKGSQFPFHCAIRKYGWEAFRFTILRRYETERAAHRAEIRTIAREASQDREIGYNIADGGMGIGSNGAKEVHARPEFRTMFLAGRFERAKKAAATRARRRAQGYYAANAPGSVQTSLFS